MSLRGDAWPQQEGNELVFLKAEERDSGNYTCLAANGAGRAEVHAELVVTQGKKIDTLNFQNTLQLGKCGEKRLLNLQKKRSNRKRKRSLSLSLTCPFSFRPVQLKV